ncbi:hypothetical protein K438DRAFT_2036378 [Mycena galopus ATCC 62051]|nr:hypothetical protein K438DRAFT_2036378 [Mycena galopus ATCC 62051]
MSTSAASPPAPTTRTSDYIAIKRQLGKGHNAVVYLVDYNTDPIPRAVVSCLFKPRPNPCPGLPRTSTGPSALVDRRGTEEAKIRREIAIMKKCDHPNIIKFFSFIDDQMSANVPIQQPHRYPLAKQRP